MVINDEVSGIMICRIMTKSDRLEMLAYIDRLFVRESKRRLDVFDPSGEEVANAEVVAEAGYILEYNLYPKASKLG